MSNQTTLIGVGVMGGAIGHRLMETAINPTFSTWTVKKSPRWCLLAQPHVFD